MKILVRSLTLVLVFLLSSLACQAQGGGCVCPPGSSVPTGPGGPAPGPPPILGPDGQGPGGGATPPGQGPSQSGEQPVGDFNQWLQNNPNSPIGNLAGQAGNDPALQNVLNQLTPSELANLGNLLTVYQNGINGYVAQNPRTWDTAGGGVRNFLNSLSALGGNDPFVRGCADMSVQAQSVLGPHTGGNNPFTVHGYDWTPGAVRQYGMYGGAPIAGVLIVKGAAAGTALGGPLGTLVGGTGGLIIAVSTGNTEHNMAALQSTRDPKLVIVLDPHSAQNGNPESVHGPGYYSGLTGSPNLGPPKVPASLSPGGAAGGSRQVERGTVGR